MARVTGIAVSPSGQVLSAGHIDFLRIPAFPVGFGGDTVFPDMIRVPIGAGGVIDFTLIEGAYAAVWSLGRVEVEFAFTVSGAADIQFNEGLGAQPMPDVAPTIVAQGSVSPASGAVGTQFTFTAPVVSGRPTPVVTRVVTLNGSPVTVNGNSYTSTSAGALAVAWTATNGVGSPATSSASATVTAASSAPVITQQPRITPASATVGDSVTINLGAATGAVGAPTWTLMLGATDVTAQAIGDPLAYETTAAGNLTLAVSWTNATGTTVANPATITVAEAPSGDVDLSDAAIYIPTTSDPAANLSLPLVAQGRLAASFAATAGGGTLQSSPRGIEFDGTNRLILNDVNISTGYYIAGIITVDTLIGTMVNLRSAGGQFLSVRRNGNALQCNWSYGNAVNSTGGFMPALAVGTPVVFGVEVNQVANTIRFWNGTAFNTMPLATVAPGALEATILRLGGDNSSGFMDGAIKDFVLEPLAGQAITFEQALAELGAAVAPPFP